MCISKIPSPHLPCKAYKMLLRLHKRNRRTWASSICCVLYRFDFDGVRENQGIGDDKMFLKELKERLLALYKQKWATSLRTNDRFFFYSTFKSTLSLSFYLNDLKHVKVRNFLIRIRLGISQLKTHELWFTMNRSQADLTCPFCRHHTENEMHLILTCPRYKEIQEPYIPKKYYSCPSSLNSLFS